MSKSIEQLKDEKTAALRELDRVSSQYKQALTRYEEAAKALEKAEMYEKAKRQVMRDLIQSAGNLNDPP